MDKNEKEKIFLYEWGIENSTQYVFPKIEKEKESYFIKREEKSHITPYIREYGFETLPELTKELDVLWENDETFEKIKKVIGIAFIKNKPVEIMQEKVKTEEQKKDKEDKLPAFIYNF